MSAEGVLWRCNGCRASMYTPLPWRYRLCLGCRRESAAYRCPGGYLLLVVPVPLESRL